MATTIPNYSAEYPREHSFDAANSSYRQAAASAVSWGAIVAGAAAAASLGLILLILGTGLGLSTVSPWAQRGVDATTFGLSTILWLTLTQLLASAMGGYLAGRLRTKWIDAQTDEIYFRDTAHGFLAWAVAALVSAGLLTATVGAIVGGGVQAGATVGGSALAAAAVTASHVGDNNAAGGTADNATPGYFIDTLFRRNMSPPVPSYTDTSPAVQTPARASAPDQDEVARIFHQVGQAGAMPADDQRYLAQLVAQHTGLSPADAERRVTDTHARLQTWRKDTETAARLAADEARKTAAYGALWLFVALLAGAFVASLAATIGGHQRDA